MKKTAVINIVGLNQVSELTPELYEYTKTWNSSKIKPAFPAVTCSAQTTYLTGTTPSNHGICGNGWYYKEENEIKFWKQSAALVQQERIWDTLKRTNPEIKVANLFWWFNMYSTADIEVTPRPMYPADGRKIPDIFTKPYHLRKDLQETLGQFPLFHFWGPAASIKSSQWIAACAKYIEEHESPDLTFVYIPHLDYDLQRFGPSSEKALKAYKEVDALVMDLLQYYEKKNIHTILLSEYAIEEVHQEIALNRILRKHNYIQIREELGKELLDAGSSRAFAVCDHQIAHIYTKHTKEVYDLLSKVDGIDELLDKEQQKKLGVNHDRSGDMIAVAKQGYWFSYYYWDDHSRAPDFASTVDIHRKPGYVPAELLIDKKILFPKLKIVYRLLQKKMGLRMLMDVIPVTGADVKGSHGRIPSDMENFPFYSSKKHAHNKILLAEDIKKVILEEICS